MDEFLLGTVLVTICSIFTFVFIFRKSKQQKSFSDGLKNRDLSKLQKDLWHNTPLIKSEWLTSFVNNDDNSSDDNESDDNESDDNDNDTEVFLKLEALQPSGSFKIRGISTFIKKSIYLNAKLTTFVSTSTANAGMAVAYTTYKLGYKCLLILDESNKNNALIPKFKSFGAKIEFNGKTWNDSDEYAQKLCDKNDTYCYVPMYDHSFIFNGHSSIMNEIQDNCIKLDVNDPDCIIVTVGGGGLLCGVLSGLFKISLIKGIDIYAAQTENGQLYGNAVRNNYKPIPVKTISSEGYNLGYRAVCSKVMDLSERFKKMGNEIKSIVCKDKDILNMCTMFALQHHILIEPLCAAGLTALYTNKNMFKKYQNIVIIVCGGDHFYYNGKCLELKDILPQTYSKNFDISKAKEIEEEEKDNDDNDVSDIDKYESDEEEI